MDSVVFFSFQSICTIFEMKLKKNLQFLIFYSTSKPVLSSHQRFMMNEEWDLFISISKLWLWCSHLWLYYLDLLSSSCRIYNINIYQNQQNHLEYCFIRTVDRINTSCLFNKFRKFRLEKKEILKWSSLSRWFYLKEYYITKGLLWS